MSNRLAVKDLIPGEYYHIEESSSGILLDLVFIFMKDNGDPDRPQASFYVSMMDEMGVYKKEEGNKDRPVTPWITGRECRVATDEERDWLDACIIKDKFIEKEEAKAFMEAFRGSANPSPTGIPSQRITGMIRITGHKGEPGVPGIPLGDFYNVILVDPGKSKLSVIKALKDLTGLGLKEAKDLVDASPSTVGEGLSIGEANYIKNGLEAAGANVQIKFEFIGKQQYDLSRKDMVYIGVDNLKDTSDERIMMNYMDDLSFVGFSRINGSPIFKLMYRGQTEDHWQGIMREINEIGNVQLYTGNMVKDHLIHLPEFQA